MTGTLRTISIFTCFFFLLLLLSFFNNLIGTGWLQKITGNKRGYFKILKRAMGIFFSSRIPSSSPPFLLIASPTPNYHQQQI